jgi:hypothetical protein
VRRFVLIVLLGAMPAGVAAQSSQFGTRGLGLPGREESARALGTGGAFALFDPQSSVSPAAVAYLPAMTATFTILTDYRSATDPGGTTTLRDFHFPQFAVGGPIPKVPLSVGLSYSNYTTRDYSLVFPAMVILRGVPVGVSDTIESRGGINDFRLAVAYRLSTKWAVGAAAHIITGSNRLNVSRVFSDTTYHPSRQRAEVSYAGFGMSIGIVGQLARTLSVSLLARSDGHVSVEEDSLPNEQRVDLPITVGGGLIWRPTAKLQLAGQFLARNWSTANDDLIANGGVGAVNTVEAAGGLEFVPNPRRPGRNPLRLGFRYAQLPFPLSPGIDSREYGLSIGTGHTFAADRAGIDLAVERIWRSQDDSFNERAWLVTFGITVRP